MVNLSGKELKIDSVKISFSLLTTLILFSLFEIISKKIELDSITLTAIRFFLGGLFIFACSFKLVIREIKLLNVVQILQIFFTGFLNVCIAMLSLQFAVKLGNATTSAIIISSNPLFVYLIQTLFLNENNITKEDKNIILRLIRLFLLLLGIFGIFLVIYKKDKGDNIYSILLAIFASISFASYVLISKNLLKKVSGQTLNSFSFTLNGLILLIISLIFYQDQIKNYFLTTSLENLFLLIILSFGTTGIGYITYFYALKRLDAVKVSLVFYLKPIVVVILNSIILHEIIGYSKLTGIFLIVLSLLLYVNLGNLCKNSKLFNKN